MSRIIIDANGVLMERADINKPEELIKDNFFSLRIPEWNVLGAIKKLLKENPDTKISIVVNIPYSQNKAREEIMEWLLWYLPEIKDIKILPMGEYFGSYFLTDKSDVLISSNLTNIMIYTYNGGMAVGVDIDNELIKEIGYFSTYNSKGDIYNYLLFLLENI